MAYKIIDECLICGTCMSECPNEAISEGEIICIIDPERCTECVGTHERAQCVTICPVDALTMDPEYKESHDQLLEKWKRLHPGEIPATTLEVYTSTQPFEQKICLMPNQSAIRMIVPILPGS